MGKGSTLKRNGVGKTLIQIKGYQIKPIEVKGKPTKFGIFKGKKKFDESISFEMAKKKASDEAFFSDTRSKVKKDREEYELQQAREIEKKAKLEKHKEHTQKAKKNMTSTYFKKKK